MVAYDIDAGLLTVSTFDVLDTKRVGSSDEREAYLNAISSDGVQHLMNTLFELPFERVEDGRIVQLPEPELRLPREKHIPKGPVMSTWQKFAQRKGIKKRKRERLQYDESNEDWRPRYGSHKANKESDQWVVEHNDRDHAEVDPWAKMAQDKAARVAKNRKQQVKNFEAAEGRRVPGQINLAAVSNRKNAKDKDGHVKAAYDMASKSTASMGAFDKRVNNLEPAKDKTQRVKAQTVRQQPRTNIKSEKDANLKLLSRILNTSADDRQKGARLDKDKAANLESDRSQRKRARTSK
ncbi:Ribosome biogenesis regulatory protein [Plasmodiophora brassicae]|uniref:Ribosome biogenesis regulatory protein n=1 Tax=Plasmodiophora brassicae TaxID=37360 RepID=A0A0G4J2H9_PLABS|nr:hypothetical protein PBRA_008692 [Plasmodiophora brassicae]